VNQVLGPSSRIIAKQRAGSPVCLEISITVPRFEEAWHRLRSPRQYIEAGPISPQHDPIKLRLSGDRLVRSQKNLALATHRGGFVFR